ncbi:hypothetical protein [Micromonospora sp. NPDC005367]|uniref:hypothetical protein n=1 Tax=Micromonospora sp. NPDC005367 TaxID=3155590 RepID=UPI0033BDAC4C
MNDTKQSVEDLAILEQFRLDHNHSGQAGRVKVFKTMVAEGIQQEAPYAPGYQSREGTWVGVSAWAIAQGA